MATTWRPLAVQDVDLPWVLDVLSAIACANQTEGRVSFTDAACDPASLLVFTIDEVSFLVPEALHRVDVQLRRLRGLPDVPFGGVAVILAGDFWQKAPPRQSSLAEMLAATDMPGLSAPKPLAPMNNRIKSLEIFRHARRTVLTQQMRAADDPSFQEDLLQLRELVLVVLPGALLVPPCDPLGFRSNFF